MNQKIKRANSNKSFLSSHECSFVNYQLGCCSTKSTSIRKKLDGLISRYQARIESIKRISSNYYISDTKTNMKTINAETQTEFDQSGIKKSIDEFYKDESFMQFLKSISMYCQNEKIYTDRYKNFSHIKSKFNGKELGVLSVFKHATCLHTL